MLIIITILIFFIDNFIFIIKSIIIILNKYISSILVINLPCFDYNTIKYHFKISHLYFYDCTI